MDGGMIMEDFVTFEIAKKLKEKGFREECLYHYQNCGDYAEANRIPGDDRYDFNTDYLYQCNNNDSYLIDAPTIAQVLKWLREKEISIEPCATPYNYWYYMIKEKGTIKATYTGEDYNNYEQAALAGIEYVIDNLI